MPGPSRPDAFGARPGGGPDRPYLVGTSGLPNFGDEFVLRAWIGFLGLRRPDAELWLDSPQPGVVTTLMAPCSERFRSVDTLWRTAWGIGEWDDAEAAFILARERVNHLGTPRADIGLEQLRSASSVHLLGGGYVNAMWPVNCLLPALCAASGALSGHPLFATGLGELPLTDSTEALLVKSLREFDSVELREADSPLVAAVPGLRLGVDDAFLALHPRLRSSCMPVASGNPPRYMLLVQGDMHSDLEARDRTLTVALAELDRAGWTSDQQLGVCEAIPPDDAWVLAALADRGVRDVRFYPFMTLWQDGLPLRSGQYWVTTRFHFHLLVAAHGIAGTAIVISSDYYGPKHASLTALGTGWRTVSLTGDVIDPGSLTASSSFARVAEGLATEKWRLAESLYPTRQGLSPADRAADSLARYGRRVVGTLRRKGSRGDTEP